nr:hypothetical protein CFP56_30021 [Quercus suber]
MQISDASASTVTFGHTSPVVLYQLYVNFFEQSTISKPTRLISIACAHLEISTIATMRLPSILPIALFIYTAAAYPTTYDLKDPNTQVVPSPLGVKQREAADAVVPDLSRVMHRGKIMDVRA